MFNVKGEKYCIIFCLVLYVKILVEILLIRYHRSFLGYTF